ncbi:hypothetical protein ACHAQA_009266 [Verticillium albo-atrum]
MRISALAFHLLPAAVLLAGLHRAHARHDALGLGLRERDSQLRFVSLKQRRGQASQGEAKAAAEGYQPYSWGYGYGYPAEGPETTSTEETSEEETSVTDGDGAVPAGDVR